MNKTMLVRNVLMVKPNASLQEVRAIMPALVTVPDSQLTDWMNQTRRRLGSEARTWRGA